MGTATITDEPSPEKWVELLLFCSGGGAAAFFALLFARLSAYQEIIRHRLTTCKVATKCVRVVPASGWFSLWLLIVGCLLLVVCAGLELRRRQRAPRRLGEIFEDPRARITAASFYAGILVGGVVRFVLGGVYATSFATGSAPILAGILVGVIVAGIGENDAIPWHRQLALLYLLIGSVATALETIAAPPGWIFAFCFIVIFGGLTAAVCLTWDIVVSNPDGHTYASSLAVIQPRRRRPDRPVTNGNLPPPTSA